MPRRDPKSAYYHLDVINAFEAAPQFAATVGQLPGQISLAAHSLGNMVASSAIVDHQLDVHHYFMIDAAVAMEAYDRDARNLDEMVPEEWRPYAPWLLASEWHTLFSDDGRTNFTWRGRFGVIPNAFNYFSSGEEVLANNLTDRDVTVADAPTYAWVVQEMIKGTFQPAILRRVEAHGGWGFNRAHTGTDGHVTEFPLPAHKANELNPDALTTQPFFLPFANAALFGENGGTVATNSEVLAKHLAEALPAMSRAAGANSLGASALVNQDMQQFNNDFLWPAERAQDRAWRHNDMRDVAYFYTYRLYDDLVDQGTLQ